MDKQPDYSNDRYLGEIIRDTCPSLYGKPVYYTDGTRIPYTITIPKFKTANNLVEV